MTDPIDDAFKALHQGNLIAAKDARIRQLVEHIYDMSKCGQAMTYLLLEMTIECPEERRKRDALINRWDRFKSSRDKDMKKNNEWPVDHE